MLLHYSNNNSNKECHLKMLLYHHHLRVYRPDRLLQLQDMVVLLASLHLDMVHHRLGLRLKAMVLLVGLVLQGHPLP